MASLIAVLLCVLLPKGGYIDHRVFFADEQTAISAGYRPCAVCMPREYGEWKGKE